MSDAFGDHCKECEHCRNAKGVDGFCAMGMLWFVGDFENSQEKPSEPGLVLRDPPYARTEIVTTQGTLSTQHTEAFGWRSPTYSELLARVQYLNREFEKLRTQILEDEEAAQAVVRYPESQDIELSQVRRAIKALKRLQSIDGTHRNDLYEARSALAKEKERSTRLGERLIQLEGIVQSATARAVRGLSQDARSRVQADGIATILEDHHFAKQELDRAEIPELDGKVTTRVRRLIRDTRIADHEKPGTITVEGSSSDE